MIQPSEPRPEKPFRPYAGKYRSRSHESAHTDASAPESVQVAHPLVPNVSGELITEPTALDDLLAHLRQEGRFAYDSEFIGELTYIPKLCLIQVATSKRIALIDPLAQLDLNPFWLLLTDPSIEKIVHAGQQDIEPIHRHTGQPAANIFDTQICAGFIGLNYPVALSKLVQHLMGARLGKGLTFTHWDQRPLSSQQLRYAADDVRYLLAVHDEINKQLTALGHTNWALEECQSLCDPNQYGFDSETHFLRFRGADSLPPRNQQILKELTIWRDGVARGHDVPARSLIKDDVLLDLARSPVKSVDKLGKIRGLPRPVEQSYGAQIIETIAKGLSADVQTLPQKRDVEPTPQQRFRADGLWAAVQCLCAGQSIDPALVTSRQEIGELYRRLDENEPAEDLQILQGWRLQAVGQTLLDFLQGKTMLKINWSDSLTTRPTPSE